MKLTDHYKVDILESKLYTNSWGVVDNREKAFHMEAIINERFTQGYKLHSFQEFLYTSATIVLVFEKIKEN
jgi:hypothetical protein